MKSYTKNIVFLLGILAVEALNNSVLAKSPIDGDSEPGAENMNSQNFDYDLYSDDEESPAEQNLPSKSTLKPYFNEENITEYVMPGDKIVLSCPVQNYDDSKHQILWFKENTPITNGPTALSNAYILDKSFNLTIESFTDETSGKYYCRVMCGKDCKVSQQTLVIVGESPIATSTIRSLPDIQPPNSGNQSQLSASLAIVTLMIVLEKQFAWA